jgi:mRNA-degrading endonuclease toxin of MazEF toxin-antitoxin module
LVFGDTQDRRKSLTLQRGDLVFGSLETNETGDVATKRFLVVSTDAINELGMFPVLVRVTKKTRDRSAPTAVEVEPDSENNLPETSYFLCHDLVTLSRENIGERFGRLGIADLFHVEEALRYALSL